jgi:hypothetical protein
MIVPPDHLRWAQVFSSFFITSTHDAAMTLGRLLIAHA